MHSRREENESVDCRVCTFAFACFPKTPLACNNLALGGTYSFVFSGSGGHETGQKAVNAMTTVSGEHCALLYLVFEDDESINRLLCLVYCFRLVGVFDCVCVCLLRQSKNNETAEVREHHT